MGECSGDILRSQFTLNATSCVNDTNNKTATQATHLTGYKPKRHVICNKPAPLKHRYAFEKAPIVWVSLGLVIRTTRLKHSQNTATMVTHRLNLINTWNTDELLLLNWNINYSRIDRWESFFKTIKFKAFVIIKA